MSLGNLAARDSSPAFGALRFFGDLFDQLFPADDFDFLDEADHVGEGAAPGAVEDAVVVHGVKHVDDAGAEFFCRRHRLRRMREIELIDGPEGPALTAGGLDFVEAERSLVPMGKFAESAEKSWEGDAMAAGALEGLDDDAGDFVADIFSGSPRSTARLWSAADSFSVSGRDVSMKGKGTLRLPVMKPWKSRVMTGSWVSWVTCSAKIVRP